MLETLYNVPFLLLEVPNLKIKQPGWLHMPSSMTVFSVVMFSYFLVTGGECLVSDSYNGILNGFNFVFFLGIIYDVIVEPPSVGSTTDEHGHSRPVSAVAWFYCGSYFFLTYVLQLFRIRTIHFNNIFLAHNIL